MEKRISGSSKCCKGHVTGEVIESFLERKDTTLKNVFREAVPETMSPQPET